MIHVGVSSSSFIGSLQFFFKHIFVNLANKYVQLHKAINFTSTELQLCTVPGRAFIVISVCTKDDSGKIYQSETLIKDSETNGHFANPMWTLCASFSTPQRRQQQKNLTQMHTDSTSCLIKATFTKQEC